MYQTIHFLKKILFLFLFFISGNIQSQTLSYQSFDQKSGLKSLDIHCIIQDRYGYVWIGSDKGLSMWDSKNFTHFTVEDGLVNDNVFKLYDDGQGRLWIVSFSKKLCYYSYKDKKIYNSSSVKYLDKINVHFNTDLILKNNELFYFSNDYVVQSYNFKSEKNKIVKDLTNAEMIFLVKDSLKLVDIYLNKGVMKYFLSSNLISFDTFDLVYKDFRYVYAIGKNTKIYDLKTGEVFQKPRTTQFFYFKNGSLTFNKNLYFKSNLIDNDISRIDIISKGLGFFLNKNRLNLLKNLNILKLSSQNVKMVQVYEKQLFYLNDSNILVKNHKNPLALSKLNSIFYNFAKKRSIFYFMFSDRLIDIDLSKNNHNLKKIKSIERQKSAYILPSNIVGKYFYIKDSIQLLSTHVGLLYKKEKLFDRIYGDRVYSTFIDSRNRLWHTTLDGIYLVEKFTGGNRLRKKINFKESKNVGLS